MELQIGHLHEVANSDVLELPDISLPCGKLKHLRVQFAAADPLSALSVAF